MYKKTITHYVAKTVTDILFFLSILGTVTVPAWAKPLFGWIGYANRSYKLPFTVILFLSGACCVYILFNLRQMFRSLMAGDPFTEKNVQHFRRIAAACAAVAAIYIVKCFFMFTFATLVIATIFIAGCLFCLTLKDLFEQAVNFKSENELTI